MEEKRFLDDYSIKEIYINFPYFEEKFNNILNTQSFRVFKGNNFYSKLKFVKALKEYKSSLDLMPYVHKYSEAMISNILDNINSVRTVDNLNEHVVFNDKNREVLFNRNSWENAIYDNIMLPLTKSSLQGYISKSDNLRGFSYARIEYIAYRAANIRNEKLFRGELRKTPTLKIYDRLIKVFGEETMLKFNKEAVPNFIDRFNDSKMSKNWFEPFCEELNRLFDSNTNEADKYYSYHFLNDVLDNFEIKQKEKLEEQKLKPHVKQEIENYIKLISQVQEIPDELKNKMCSNLKKSLIDIVTKDLGPRHGGLYYSNKKLIEIDSHKTSNRNEREKVLIHELTHAATTTRDKIGRTVRVGLSDKYYNAGMAINEGSTEYITEKIYSKTGKKLPYLAYKELVSVIKDITKLYGDNIIVEAMLEGPERLEELMEQDGKSYAEFREITDDYYRIVYDNKDLPFYKARKTLEAKESYKKIGNFIEEIKQKRVLEKPSLEYSQFDWKKSYGELFSKKAEKGKEENISWFQKFRNMIKERFFYRKKQLVLNAANPEAKGISEKSDFIKGLEVGEIDLKGILSQEKDALSKGETEKEREP